MASAWHTCSEGCETIYILIGGIFFACDDFGLECSTIHHNSAFSFLFGVKPTFRFNDTRKTAFCLLLFSPRFSTVTGKNKIKPHPTLQEDAKIPEPRSLSENMRYQTQETTKIEGQT